MPRYPMPDDLVPFAHQGYRDRLQRLERRGSPWATWTPTVRITGGGTFTLGNGSVGGAYAFAGNAALVQIELVWGSTTTGSGSGALVVSLPAAVAPSYLDPTGLASFPTIGHSWYWDQSTPANNQVGFCDLGVVSGDVVRFWRSGSADAVTLTAPFTWTTSDHLSASIVIPL